MKKLMIFIIFIGVIGVALNIAMGSTTASYIYAEQIEGTNQIWYRMDVWGYVNNVADTFSTIPIFDWETPTTEWQNLPPNPLDSDFWEGLLNNMAFVFNWFIFAINLILLWPLRLGCYILQCIMAIIGIRVINPNPKSSLIWLINLTNTLNRWQIPYVTP